MLQTPSHHHINLLVVVVVVVLLLRPAAAGVGDFPHCDCDGGGGGHGGVWSIENIVKWQKVSDLLIAGAYFSIPLELVYFVAGLWRLLPFKWVLLQFVAFIVLCGVTHLLAAFSLDPHPFVLVVALTVAKFLTALVSFLTAVTLFTLLPQLLRVKVRESLLRRKARELDREVGLMKRQEEASRHVRMLTREIRRSLDRHTILYTTLVELSNVLDLRNCAVWMPGHDDVATPVMCLTHELCPARADRRFIGTDDPDVVDVMESDGVKLLSPDSILGSVSGGNENESGPVAAIRMPMLKVSNFKGGTPQMLQASYAILVLVLPRDKSWVQQELDIVQVVADQVAVALSHASVLEESQAMRDRLAEQNRALHQAKRDAVMANDARAAFQNVMSQGMRRPIHSVLALVSVLQEDRLAPDQRLVIDAMARTGRLVSTLIDDVLDSSTANRDQFPLDTRPFHLHSLVKEAACVAQCLCHLAGFRFRVHADNALPDLVVGDERRIFHVIMHMIGKMLIHRHDDGGYVTFRVRADDDMDGSHGQGWDPWRPNYSGGCTCVKFDIGIKRSQSFDSSSSVQFARPPDGGEVFDLGLSFSMCKRLVQLMQGNICAIHDSEGYPESMTLVLMFQLQPQVAMPAPGGSFERRHVSPPCRIRGLKVLLADDEGINRAVMQKLLEKLGCVVVSFLPSASISEFLSSMSPSCAPFRLIIIDLDMSRAKGFDVATRILKHRSGCWPVVVAVTASTKDNIWEKCVQSGIAGLVKKPVALQELREELIRVLQNS